MIIDITLPVHNNMPVWPTSTGICITRVSNLDNGDVANVSRLECDVHTGTHVDAPRHFFADGQTVENLDIETLLGPAYVAYLPEVKMVTRANLEQLALPIGIRRLLLRTYNSEWWKNGEAAFRKDYIALTVGAAKWVVEKNIALLGVDYLSVQRYNDGPATHQVLLQDGVVIVEGLNLSAVDPGIYELVCLPLRLVGAEGAPARAVLRTP